MKNIIKIALIAYVACLQTAFATEEYDLMQLSVSTATPTQRLGTICTTAEKEARTLKVLNFSTKGSDAISDETLWKEFQFLLAKFPDRFQNYRLYARSNEPFRKFNEDKLFAECSFCLSQKSKLDTSTRVSRAVIEFQEMPENEKKIFLGQEDNRKIADCMRRAFVSDLDSFLSNSIYRMDQ